MHALPRWHHAKDQRPQCADCKLGKNEPRAQEKQLDCYELTNIHMAIMRLPPAVVVDNSDFTRDHPNRTERA